MEIERPIRSEWNARSLARKLAAEPNGLVGTDRLPFSAIDVDLRNDAVDIERARYPLGHPFENDVIRISLPRDMRTHGLSRLLKSDAFIELLHVINDDLEAAITGKGTAHELAAEIESGLFCKLSAEK
nr:hypothetical protein [Brucella intermedia]